MIRARSLPDQYVFHNDKIESADLKPTLTSHYFRHNYVNLLYESGVDPLVAMKMVGYRERQTTANIYTHLKEDSLKKAAADMATVFKKKKDAKQVKKAVGGNIWEERS